MMLLEENKYICINCGSIANELYKVYSPTVLKLSTCNVCDMVVDKYIEYDPIIIIIDLVLLNREAYRHALFNTHFTIHWKLLVILELMEAYWELAWTSKLQPDLTLPSNNRDSKPILLDKFFTGDMEYYMTLFRVIYKNVFFLLVIIGLTHLRVFVFKSDNQNFTSNKKQMIKQIFSQVMKCITISSFGILLFLPSLIWEKNGTEDYHLVFVIIYTTLSQLVAYTVLCQCSKIWSIIVILSAYAIKMNASNWLSTWI